MVRPVFLSTHNNILIRPFFVSSLADPPMKDIHSFLGNLTVESETSQPDIVPLNVENILWANTVLAAGSAVGMVVYTGKETRAAMNTSEPETKTGLLGLEINRIAKVSLACL
jgi:phospholipid-translocating ATPase